MNVKIQLEILFYYILSKKLSIQYNSGHPFFRRRILVKKVCSPKLWSFEKRTQFVGFSPKKIQKVLTKIKEMVDVFLNSANFAKHTFLTLVPPSGYALNLKVLIKVLKFGWTSQLLYEILCFHLKENLIRQTSFLQKKPSQKPASFKVKRICYFRINFKPIVF